jgi:hypothetical protein
MDTTFVNVEDSPYIITNTINRVAINISKIDLFKSVTIAASLYNDKKLLANKIITLTGAEYDAWGNNDQYIIDITLEKLGLKEKSGVTVSF